MGPGFHEKSFFDRAAYQLFFKGGNQKLGCEFLHKSFREYIFAEYVIEVLKRFGKAQKEPWSERSDTDYWKDFPEKGNLWTLSRNLGECLSAQWMSAEVAKHLQALIEWEIDRSDHDLVDATEGFDYTGALPSPSASKNGNLFETRLQIYGPGGATEFICVARLEKTTGGRSSNRRTAMSLP